MNTAMKTAVGIGLAGAHRAGKTSIARIVAEKSDCSLILSSGEAIADACGYKVYPGMPMIQRRDYQERVLEAFVEQWDKEHGLFVCDRTPLDFAAYALADYRPEHAEALAHKEWLADYVERCLDVTRKYFFSVVVVQPGIPYIAAPGKPAPDLIYQEIIAGLVLTMAFQVTDAVAVSAMGRNFLGLDERVGYVENQYVQVMRGFILDGVALNGVH